MADITMPQLGETVTEGTITRWAKQVGDKVELDEVLFEVSTDKVDSEVPSSAAGYISEILVPEGETVDVGTRLAVISAAPPGNGAAAGAEAPAAQSGAAQSGAVESGALESGAAQSGAAQSGAAAAASAPSGRDAPAAADEGPSPAPAEDEPRPEEPEEAPLEEVPATVAARSTASGSSVTAPGEKAPPRAAPTRPEPRAASSAGGDGDSRLLSPVVRRLIAEHELDPSTLKGTGAGGRITRDDVLAVIDARAGGATATPPRSGAAPPPPPQPPAPSAAPSAAGAGQPAPAAAPAARGAAAPAAAAPAGRATGEATAAPTSRPAPADRRDRDEVIPFTKIRRITAEHMVRSKATSAHTLVVDEVDFVGVDRVRDANQESFRAQEGHGLTYLPFISRAVVDAIEEFPHVNASVGNDELIVHHGINLGIAVDLNFEGLLVPVIHDADGKRLRAIAREIADLAARARSKRLTADDIAGGTFTITNAGPFGTLLTAAVINQPQVAILSTDGVKKRPVAIELPDGSDAVAVHPVGLLALSFDHRAFDGAYAAAFLSRVRAILETRDWAQEL